jgi:hypothetical protein
MVGRRGGGELSAMTMLRSRNRGCIRCGRGDRGRGWQPLQVASVVSARFVERGLDGSVSTHAKLKRGVRRASAEAQRNPALGRRKPLEQVFKPHPRCGGQA